MVTISTPPRLDILEHEVDFPWATDVPQAPGHAPPLTHPWHCGGMNLVMVILWVWVITTITIWWTQWWSSHDDDLTHWCLGDRDAILKMQFSILFHWQVSSYDKALRSCPFSVKTHWSQLMHICQWSGSSLDQIMARHLFSDPLVIFCQMDPGEQTSEKIWIKRNDFRTKKSNFKILSAKWQWFCLNHFVSGLNLLTFNVQGPSYLGLTRSISWLLMAWLLTSPGHQSHDIDYIKYVGPGLTWGRILSTCVISMWSNDTKCKYMFMFPLKNLARIELRNSVHFLQPQQPTGVVM